MAKTGAKGVPTGGKETPKVYGCPAEAVERFAATDIPVVLAISDPINRVTANRPTGLRAQIDHGHVFGVECESRFAFVPGNGTAGDQFAA